MKRHLILSALTALASTVFTAPAVAGTDDAKNPPPMQVTAPDNGWWFRAAPYVWATSVTGDVGIDPFATHVDLSFGDLLKHFDMGFEGVFEAGYGRWGFGTDFIYARVSGSADLSSGPFFNSASLKLEEWYITPRITYNVLKSDHSDLDLLVGGRIIATKTTLNLQGGLPAVHVEDTQGWIDPIVGFRGRCDLGEKFFFNYYGDIGGFDAASEITWQAVAGFGYKINANSAVGLGYRALYDDYHRDGLLLKLLSHGPYIGYEMKF